MTDVVHHHLFGFVGNDKRIGVPAPVSIQKDTVLQVPVQLAADGSFSYSHRPADQKKTLLHTRSPFRKFHTASVQQVSARPFPIIHHYTPQRTKVRRRVYYNLTASAAPLFFRRQPAYTIKFFGIQEHGKQS